MVTAEALGVAKPDPADRAGCLIDKRTFIFVGDREMIRDRAAASTEMPARA